MARTLGALAKRVATLERMSLGITTGAGAGALHSGDALTGGDVQGNLLGPITIRTSATPTVTKLTVSNPAAAISELDITSTVGQRAMNQLSDGATSQWFAGKESTNSYRILRSSVNAGNGPTGTDYAGGTDAISPTVLELGVRFFAAWAASTAYTLGQVRVPVPQNGHRYVVTTAGTSGATAPTWSTTAGATVTDGTVVWTEAGSSAGPADAISWNKLKVWAVPNTIWGNAAIDASLSGTLPYMAGRAGAKIGDISNYRIAVSVAGYADSSNGTRDGSTGGATPPSYDMISADAACGGDASFFNAFAAIGVIRAADLGSIQNYPSYLTVDEPATDASYTEAYSYPTAIYNYRRGALLSAGESGLHLYRANQVPVAIYGVGTHDGRSSGAHAGPARSSGYSIILDENNPYADYNNSGIFGVGSNWMNSGARGLWVHNNSFHATYGQRAGTGVYVGGYYAGYHGDTAEFWRALVYNVGSRPSSQASPLLADPGVDKWMVDGWGNMGLGGVTINHATLLTYASSSTGLPGRITFADPISHTVQEGIQFGVTAGKIVKAYQSADGVLSIVGGLTVNGSVGFYNTAPQPQSTGWAMAGGYTAKKTFDPRDYTMDDLAAVVATLVDAHKTSGLLGA